MYANTLSRPSTVQFIMHGKVCAALDIPNGVNKYLNKPNGVIIAVFGMSVATTGIFVHGQNVHLRNILVTL